MVEKAAIAFVPIPPAGAGAGFFTPAALKPATFGISET